MSVLRFFGQGINDELWLRLHFFHLFFGVGLVDGLAFGLLDGGDQGEEGEGYQDG